jgi:oxygen-independent coproporphyrinogen-3 oxidase
MSGLYIHIPFCKQACHYCDFHFSTKLDNRSALVSALVRELELQRDYLDGAMLQTIYFGGGTPSMLSAEELGSIFQTIRANYIVEPNAEITLEANPDDLSSEKLYQLRDLGVNRLSIGVQSFDDEILTYFNRAHSAQEAVDCVSLARAAGFNNISIDLIYGTPGLDDSAWVRNIKSALALSPEHVSAYSLTIEEKTVFGRRASKGLLTAATEEIVAAQFEILMSEMFASGYEHYEISNFSRKGMHSRHNTSYWEQKPYLGIGPSAHSYNGSTRQSNVTNNPQYIRSLASDKVPYQLEILSQSNIINEFIMTRLRTHDGLDLEFLREAYGYDLAGEHAGYLRRLVDMGKVYHHGPMLVLTNKGKLLADKISSDLFVSIE